ncbi:MAG: SUMF1/EgtB/PvdO family nonheme iron enzyme, partial [Thermodesulfobacteriota bacterium]
FFAIAGFLYSPALSVAADVDILDEDELELLEEIDILMDDDVEMMEDIDEGDDSFYDDDDDLDVDTGDALRNEVDLINEDEESFDQSMDKDDENLLDTAVGKGFGKVDIKMVVIKGGCFMMGDNFGDGHTDERPVHEVCVDDFYLAESEITQKQWLTQMSFNPSENDKGGEYPLENVHYIHAQDFINDLNEKEGRFFRFPTEAEWEYAAREGGKLIRWSGTDDEIDVDDYAWNADTSGDSTHPVMQKEPNALGLYDMNGNVWEWVYDFYDMEYYQERITNNPEGPDFSIWRGLRGGSFRDDAEKFRNSARYGNVPHRRSPNVGMRLAE